MKHTGKTYRQRFRSEYERSVGPKKTKFHPVPHSPGRSHERDRVNWRVKTEDGEVLAIEPDREHEHVFEGGADPLMAAIEFAAKRLREGSSS